MSTRLDRDPEIPLAPGEELAPPVVPAKVAAAHPDFVAKVKDEYPDVLADYRARRYANAYKILDKWPEDLWTGLGQDFALLSGFLDYKAEFYSDAIDELKALAEDATFVARRPETLYYLGRAYYASAMYVKAVDALERFIRSQSVLGRPLLPASDPAHTPGVSRAARGARIERRSIGTDSSSCRTCSTKRGGRGCSARSRRLPLNRAEPSTSGCRTPRPSSPPGTRMATHPLVFAAAEHILRRPFHVRDLHGRNPLPGFGQQGLHVDWVPRDAGDPYLVVTAIWMIDAFTVENGATRVVPGSHRLLHSPPADYAQPLARHPGERVVTRQRRRRAHLQRPPLALGPPQ